LPAVAAYIDGFNLYYGMKARHRRKYMWLDVVQFVRELRPNDHIQVVRYFTAIVKNEPPAAANQINYLNALNAHNGAFIDVRVGLFKPRTIGRCKVCRCEFMCSCPAPYLSYEEKETDVALGVAMVVDAALGIGDATLLVSADSDLRPAVDAIKRMRPGRPVHVALPPSRFLRQVRFPGAGTFHVRESALRRSQLPRR
jgi:hypothetical protein